VAAGFDHRMSTETADILDRLPDMQRLYERRRAARNGAGPPFDDTFMAVVSEAVTRSENGRVRLSTIERPGEVIATDFVMSAGHESSFWLSGFDDAWAHMSPGQVNVVLCVEESMQRGDEVFDMGPGTERYKYRFTSDVATLQSHLLLRRGLWPLHTPAQFLPFGARQAVGRLVGRLRGST
jgi:CelD/BcsL family acetyltransferase involved in cellulose biosynthesis